MKGNFVLVVQWAPWHEQTHVAAAAVHLHAPFTSASYKMSDGCQRRRGNSELSASAKKLNPDASVGQFVNQYASELSSLHFATITSLQSFHCTTNISLHCSHFTALQSLYFTTITSLHFSHFTSLKSLHFTSLQSLHFNTVISLHFITITSLQSLRFTTITSLHYNHFTSL